LLKITRNDLTADELRAEAVRTKNARQARRMLAIAMVLDDHPRQLAAQAGGMDRQTLRDWLHRYNSHGVAGLVDQARSGRKPRLTPAQMDELESWVEDGPDPKKDGVVRWRCADLRDRIKTHFCIDFHERSVGKLLKKLDFSTISGRPLHPKSDLGAQEAFQDSFAAKARAAIPPAYADRPIEIWFQDEARVGQQGTVARLWAKRGTRPRIKRDRRFTWAYLFGAICPARGTGAAVVMPSVHVDAINTHLAEISQRVSVGAIALLVLDAAGWHQSQRLVIPDNIVLLPLPPYAPELNPTENVWEYLRDNILSMRIWNTYEAIVDTCCQAWNFLMATPEIITSIGNRDWAQVKI
jgi:transposase